MSSLSSGRMKYDTHAARLQVMREFTGALGTHLKNIFNTCGKQPVPDKNSLNQSRYKKPVFGVFREFSGEHPRLGGAPLSQQEFAALAPGAAWAYPKLGCVYFEKNKKGIYGNAVTKDRFLCYHTFCTVFGERIVYEI